jgi:hypothetical protein
MATVHSTDPAAEPLATTNLRPLIDNTKGGTPHG